MEGTDLIYYRIRPDPFPGLDPGDVYAVKGEWMTAPELAGSDLATPVILCLRLSCVCPLSQSSWEIETRFLPANVCQFKRGVFETRLIIV